MTPAPLSAITRLAMHPWVERLTVEKVRLDGTGGEVHALTLAGWVMARVDEEGGETVEDVAEHILSALNGERPWPDVWPSLIDAFAAAVDAVNAGTYGTPPHPGSGDGG